MHMRRRIYDIIEVIDEENRISDIYDLFMLISIVLSMIPLMFCETTPFLLALDRITVCVFSVDYLLRLMTSDYKLKKGALSFFLYPFTFMAVVDFLAMLPTFEVVGSGFKMLKVFRLLRSFRGLRVFRAFKLFRYSKNMDIIVNVLKKEKEPLFAVCLLAVGYVFLSALVMFNVEPETFERSFFNALYWATVSLTTMGYGDISPLTGIGRLLTMLSSIVGIAIVALPSGIITAGYISLIEEEKLSRKEKEKITEVCLGFQTPAVLETIEAEKTKKEQKEKV